MIMKQSLFDAVLQHLESDLDKYGSFQAFNTDMVRYIDNRTGREAYMSVGRHMAITNLIPGLRKRYIGFTTGECISPERRSENTVRKFLARNLDCRRYNHTWSLNKVSVFTREIIWEAIGALGELSNHTLADFSISNLAKLSRNGPGSSSAINNRKFSGDLAKMAEGPLSASNRYVMNMYKTMSRASRASYVAERIRHDKYGSLDVVACAEFEEVPKTNDVGRAICKHGSANMSIQLAVHEILCSLLKDVYHVDLENQQNHNRKLAMWGSKGSFHGKLRTWSFATEDLSMASDYPLIVGKTLLRDFPNLLRLVCVLRSSHLEFPPKFREICGQYGYPSGKVRKHVLSTMGNGYTFALMTLLLSTIVRVLYKRANLPEIDYDRDGKPFKTWAVFGDDIIVDVSVRKALHQVLTDLCFIVNEKKSYGTGFFRESCGADFYDGYNVRPVFLETLETKQDICSLINRLSEWGAFHSVQLDKTLNYLRSQLGEVLYVPFYEDVCSGVRAPVDVAKPVKSKLDYAGGFSYRCYSPKTVSDRIYRELYDKRKIAWTSVVFKPVADNSNSHPLVGTESLFTPITWRYCNLGTFKKRVLLGVEFYDRRVGVKKQDVSLTHSRNEWGILLCMLRGSVREGTISLRPVVTRYEVVWRHSPGWGGHSTNLVPYASVTAGHEGLGRLFLEEYTRRWQNL